MQVVFTLLQLNTIGLFWFTPFGGVTKKFQNNTIEKGSHILPTCLCLLGLFHNNCDCLLQTKAPFVRRQFHFNQLASIRQRVSMALHQKLVRIVHASKWALAYSLYTLPVQISPSPTYTRWGLSPETYSHAHFCPQSQHSQFQQWHSVETVPPCTLHTPSSNLKYNRVWIRLWQEGD